MKTKPKVAKPSKVVPGQAPKVAKTPKTPKTPKGPKTPEVKLWSESPCKFDKYELKKDDLSDPKLNENENETFEDVSKRIASEICSYIVDTSSESMDSCPQDDSCHYSDLKIIHDLLESVNNSLAKFEDVMEKHNDEFTEKMRDFNTHFKKEAFNSFLIGANIVLFVGLIAKLFT